MESQYIENIKKGMKVEIITKQRRVVRGVIEDLAAREKFHVNGILVRLKTGEIGRVQKILLNEEDKNKKLEDEIIKIIKIGENLYTEFKLNALWSQNYGNEQIKQSKSIELHEFGVKASKVIIAKSIAALMNSEGGNLIIGVKELKDTYKNQFEITGISEDFSKLKDSSEDGYKRVIIDEIVRQFFPAKIYNHLNDYLKIEFAEIEEKLVCLIRVRKSDIRVFLLLNNKKVFMIRVDSENRALEAEELVDYCLKRFR